MEASLTVAVVTALVGSTALWVWALVDVLRRPQAAGYRSGTQLLWAVVIAVTHAVGAVLYLAVGRSRPSPQAADR